MKLGKTTLIAAYCLFMCGEVVCESIHYDFNDFSEGLVNGQNGWKILRKSPGSAAVSIFDELGPTEEIGDKALVIQLSDEVSRVVAADGVRWMPGQTWILDFDFRIGITSQKLAANKPVLTVFIGDAYLSEKSRWEIRLEAAPDGTWTLGGGLPDWQEVDGIVAETVLERPEDEDAAISEWMHFTVVSRKLATPDSFESLVEIRNNAGELIAQLEFNDTLSDNQTMAIWDLSRVYCGFNAPRRQLGLVCIDNIEINSLE